MGHGSGSISNVGACVGDQSHQRSHRLSMQKVLPRFVLFLNPRLIETDAGTETMLYQTSCEMVKVPFVQSRLKVHPTYQVSSPQVVHANFSQSPSLGTTRMSSTCDQQKLHYFTIHESYNAWIFRTLLEPATFEIPDHLSVPTSQRMFEIVKTTVMCRH